MLYVPAGKPEVENVPVPVAGVIPAEAVPTSAAVPTAVEPFMKVTVPVGATPRLSVDRFAATDHELF